MPVMFEGGADPMAADDYMDQVKTQLTSMDVTEDHLKIILTTYKFAKDAKLWWKMVTNRHKVEEMSWDKFKELFYEKYFSLSKRWELKDQFLGLIQGNMSVAEYENKMRPLITAQFIKVYSEAVERALMLEVDIKDKDARREQWKQKKNAWSFSEGPLGKRNRGGSSQFQGQQSARSTPTTPMPAGSTRIGVICYRCNQPSHYKSECPQTSVNSGACFGCGQQGHKVKNCPNQGAGTSSGRGSQQRPS
ncbi:uncharacterized protein LOC132280805 [Cornus florida]|uniref:uncharacterized protein LOC132280805 n=1 Tax=Cornus florida TaxID=4283 RepID=UPI0028A25F9A|nr:uncharacterized protein LOC132280805 [Cornus florida]